MIAEKFWRGRRVFVTGHTGFKGSWLCLWLSALGAKVTGYALKPPTRRPSLFELCEVKSVVYSIFGDVRDFPKLKRGLSAAKPEIVIHMAAQPLVRESYKNPLETYQTNVMGTVHLLEAVRACRSVHAMLNVTTDKCYENRNTKRPFQENDAMGGFDPYSSSKACSELVTSAYRDSFFNPQSFQKHRVAIATARAGNVIGGGDWAADRLIPDCVRALLKNKKVLVRNPKAVRPWQHVLESLSGYLLLCEKLCQKGPSFSGAWNFGSDHRHSKNVEWLVRTFCEEWGRDAGYQTDCRKHPHEAPELRLNSSKAKRQLGWRPRWDAATAVQKTVEWTRAYQQGQPPRELCLRQIREYSRYGL